MRCKIFLVWSGVSEIKRVKVVAPGNKIFCLISHAVAKSNINLGLSKNMYRATYSNGKTKAVLQNCGSHNADELMKCVHALSLLFGNNLLTQYYKVIIVVQQMIVH